ncbi:MAG: hypothetical protein ABIE47_06605 [Pseudomonadota bacterium]
MSEVMDLVVLEGKVFDVIGVNDAKIAQAIAKYGSAEIKDLDDKEGAAFTHEGRMVFKGMRVMVEKHAKKVREKAVKFQKDVIAEEKRVIALMQPTEDYLQDQESRIEEEKARLRAEAAAKEAARIKVLVDKLYSLGCRFDGTAWTFNDVPVATQLQLIAMPEEQFAGVVKAIQTALDEEKEAKAAEAERIAKVAAEQEKERIRLTEEALRIKKEQDRVAAEQAKERERLAAEATAIHFEKDRLAREAKAAEDKEAARVKWVEEQKQKVEMERLRQEELVVTAREAAEKARIETEERIKREAEEKIVRDNLAAAGKLAKEEAARVRAEKKAARLPDKDKLTAFCNNYFARATPNQNIGDMKTDEGRLSFEAIWIIIQAAEHDCREIVEKL